MNAETPKVPKATHLYLSAPYVAVSVYNFNNVNGEVDVRLSGDNVQCGFHLPADKARELGLALIAHADFADATAAADAAIAKAVQP
jgi:hypothetical protein